MKHSHSLLGVGLREAPLRSTLMQHPAKGEKGQPRRDTTVGRCTPVRTRLIERLDEGLRFNHSAVP